MDRQGAAIDTTASDLAGRQPWQDQLFDVLKRADIRQVGYVPDAGHSRLIARCKADPDIRDVVLTTEEEGVALAAGAWLGGQRAALLMQSSGVGNCVNMLSLIRACRFPMLMLVTMRGEWEEFNPWQVPMGSIVEPTLKLCDTARRQGRRRRTRWCRGAERGAACVRRRPRRRGAAVAEADRPQGVEMMLRTPRRDGDAAGRPAEEPVRRAGARLAAPGTRSRPPATTTATSISGARWAAPR